MVASRGAGRKLLKRVYEDSSKFRGDVDELVIELHRTLKILGGCEGELTFEALLGAINNIGFKIDSKTLEKYIKCYIITENKKPIRLNEMLQDHNLILKNTLDGKNVINHWRLNENDKNNYNINGTIITPKILKDIFLDCKLKIETNGQIW